jgi:4-hydroxy-3-polyprenylbenzoate decarboxylase
MASLSMQGAVILPAMSAFYPKPQSIDDRVMFVVGKILDQLTVDNNVYQW